MGFNQYAGNGSTTADEAYADHISCRAILRPGWCYVAYFNQARPHQGIQQQIPDCFGPSLATSQAGTKVLAVPILAGLHHDYRKVA